MKKKKIISSVISACALTTASGAALVATGCSSSDEDINKNFFTIQANKDLAVEFCDIGAGIYSMKYKSEENSEPIDVTYHPHDKKDYLQGDLYYGKTVGRVIGRISDGQLDVEGRKYDLEINETPGVKNNCIHGGYNGFSFKKFTRYVEDKGSYISVMFNYVSPDGEAGFPETVDCWVWYKLYKNEPKMDMNIFAKTFGTTPLNISNHPYFRLANSGTIRNHTIKINADNRAYFEKEGTEQCQQRTNGTDMPVQNTAYDFRIAKEIGISNDRVKEVDPVCKGFDHIWKFNNEANDMHTVEFKNPDNGLQLNVTTDATGMIMYANCYPHEGLVMNSGNETDQENNAITIEPLTYFNSNDTNSLNVSPEQTFTRFISYKLSTNQ